MSSTPSLESRSRSSSTSSHVSAIGPDSAQLTASAKRIASAARMPELAGQRIAVTELRPATKTKPPELTVNGKAFVITHVRFRQNSQAPWQNIKIEDLDQSQIDDLAKKCESLFEQMDPTQKSLDGLTFRFKRENVEPTWRNSEKLGRFKRPLEEKPLEFVGITVKEKGSKKEVEHLFEFERYEPTSKQIFTDLLGAVDPLVSGVISKARPAELKRAKGVAQKKETKIPKDGNCFFHAAVQELKRLKSELKDLKHERLRADVAAWMQEHNDDQLLQDHITTAIDDFITAQRTGITQQRESLASLKAEGQSTDEADEKLDALELEIGRIQSLGDTEKRDWYLVQIAQDGFFASNPELYAVSQMFKVTINVEQQQGQDEDAAIISFAPDNVENPPSFTLIHAGNHYEVKPTTA